MQKIKTLIEAHRPLIKKLLRYVMTGGSAFVLEYLLFLLLKDGLHLYYVAANAVVYTLMFWFTFLMNKYFTFGAKGKMGAQLIRYILLYAFNLCVTNGLLYVLCSLLGLSPYIGKVLVSGMVVLWNFPIYRYFIYT